jgi:catechol 2,3-dioxygenase-like lactoylglutathione lyase family enzyme
MEDGMGVQLNHTIVWSRDQKKAAAFLSDILGLPPATRFSVFDVVELGNGVSLDFHTDPDRLVMQHYAFLVGEAEFDGVFQRINDRALTYWADPGREKAGEINRRDGGRGLYFESPDGHLLEVLTRPYGSGGA